MSAVAETLRSLLSVLEGRGVGWYVFGAQAVAVRGAPRATQDVDITVDVAPDHLEALLADLEDAGLRHRFPDMRESLLARAAVLPMVHESGMEVDMVLAGSGLEALVLREATPVAIDGVEVPVASATHLVVMKILAARGKDLDDVRALLAGGEVDLAVARDLLSQLEEALAVSDLLARLDEAVDAGSLP